MFIKDKKVCVVGLGYVGLPTACVLANSGYQTTGFDINRALVNKLNSGVSRLNEPAIRELVKNVVRNKQFRATYNKNVIVDADVIIICVQTPVTGVVPNLDALKAAVRTVASNIKPGAIVILESSVPPGTCQNKILPIFKIAKQTDGKTFFFGYLPERLSPGDSINEFANNTRILGVNNQDSKTTILSFLKTVITGEILTSTIVTAEITKLAENASRDVAIAFSNELSKVCIANGASVWDVIQLANTHPRVSLLRPGPGVGGPCLTKDSYLLNTSKSSIMRTARNINDNMYKEVVALIAQAGKIRGKKISVFGVTYKPDVDDTRFSPSEKVIKTLMLAGAKITTYDPYSHETFGAKRALSFKAAVQNADCVVFLVAHTEFKHIDPLSFTTQMAQPVVIDAVNLLSDLTPNKKYLYLKLGAGESPK